MSELLVQIDAPYITRALQHMVRIRSTNPDLSEGGAGEAEIAAWMLNACQAIGLEARLQPVANGRPNVIARWRGTGGGKSLLLTGHMDTVSVENMEGDPFDGRIEGNRLYGRGSYDMKGGNAAILGAISALRQSGWQPRGDIWLAFVIDEEYASIGTDALVNAQDGIFSEGSQIDAALLVEPTDGDIVIAHKGFAWVTITTYGRAAHGSLYSEGIDAITAMGHVLTAIDKLERESFHKREHPLVGRASAHASLISGGLGLSTYPDQCTLQIEQRLLPHETADDALKLWQGELARLAKRDDRFRAKVELDLFRPGFEIAKDAPIVKALQGAITHETGASALYAGMWAWMDSAILSRAGIPTVIYGTNGEGAHAAVEYVYLDSVMRCAAIYARLIMDWVDEV
jgi:acetylornithine deacetylase